MDDDDYGDMLMRWWGFGLFVAVVAGLAFGGYLGWSGFTQQIIIIF